MNKRSGFLRPLQGLFIFFTLVFVSAALLYPSGLIEFKVMIAANCLFYLICLVTFGIQKKAMDNSNPNVFIRTVMMMMLLKMLVIIAAVMAYVLISGKSCNKPAVYFSMLLYGVYLVTEVALMMKLNKSKNA